MTSLSRPALFCVMCALFTTLNAAPPVAKPAGEGKAQPAVGDVMTAEGIPSLPGYVRSPYTNPPQLVDVKGAAPGSTVICPYTQRPFIVPSDVNGSAGSAETNHPKTNNRLAETAAGVARSGKDVKNPAVVLPDPESPWRFTIGAQWRQIGNVDWQTGSAASSWSLPWLAGHGSNSGGGNIPRGIGNHAYDDGFVNQDAGTPFNGNTWFWGYNSASQLQGTDLVFHSANGGPSSFQRSSTSSLKNSAWGDDLEGAGIFAKLESPELLRIGSIGLSLELGYSWARDDTSNVTRDVFHAVQSTVASGGGSITDRYDVTGVIVPLAPFAGTFGGPGPVIPNAPYARTFGNGGGGGTTVESAVFSSDVRERFAVNLHTLSFGPHFSTECCKNVRLGMGMGLALNIADWDADYDETLSVRQNGGKSRVLKRWHADESGTDVLPGFYLEATCQVSITERLAAYVAGRYDWSDGLDEQVGPSHVNFEPGGWSVMLGLTVSL